MRRNPAQVVALALFACAFLFAPETAADEGPDFHWDASLQAGVMKRWFAGNPPGPHPGFGPAGQLAGHVALLPLIYLGGYFGADVSPNERGGLRNFEYGGAHVKVMLPFLPKSMRLWLASGVGLGRAYERSFHAAKEGGKFFRGEGLAYGEVPLGFGVSYKFWPGWSMFAELGGRVHFANSSGDGTPDDRFALGLSLGLMLDR